MIARTKYCTTTTASNWFVTLYYKLLPAVRSPSKHGRWRSSLLLYSISMVLGQVSIGPSWFWAELTRHRYDRDYNDAMFTFQQGLFMGTLFMRVVTQIRNLESFIPCVSAEYGNPCKKVSKITISLVLGTDWATVGAVNSLSWWSCF